MLGAREIDACCSHRAPTTEEEREPRLSIAKYQHRDSPQLANLVLQGAPIHRQ